jgi:hypothetical protein
MVTLALGQRVVLGDQLVLWTDWASWVAANAKSFSKRMELILSVSRQAKHRRWRRYPAHEESALTTQFVHIYSHGTSDHEVAPNFNHCDRFTEKRRPMGTGLWGTAGCEAVWV